MEKHIEVMKKSLQLSGTMLAALQHIQKLLNEGKSEQAIFLFEDVLQGYATVERTISPVVKDLNNESIALKQVDFGQATELVVTAFEEKNYAKVQEVLQFTLIPGFKKLVGELEQAFNPYIVS